MAHRRRIRRPAPAFTSGVGRLLFFSRIPRKRLPAAAAAATVQPPLVPPPPPPAPPSAVAGAQTQPPSPAPPSPSPSASAAAQLQPLPPPSPPTHPSPSPSPPHSASPAPSSSSSDACATFSPADKRKAADSLAGTCAKKFKRGESPSAPPALSSSSSYETLPRETNKRKAAESLAEADVRKFRREESTSAVHPVRKKLTLEEIRQIPPTSTRPFYPRTLVPGTRSVKEPEPWRCLMCQHVNEPNHHLLFSLPAFECKECGAPPRESEGDVDFGFCFADLAVNNTFPIGHVKDQRDDECIANAISSCVEITDRIMMIILGEPVSKEGPYIDIDDLLCKYKTRWYEEGREKPEKYIGYSAFTMLDVFKFIGVKEVNYDYDGCNEEDKVHKISDWVRLESDFVSLSSALADGYPLPFGFNRGKNLGCLQPGEIYVPPLDIYGKKLKRHFAVLVGAQQLKRLKFFYFLNSYDEDFCRGGVGAIINDGVMLPLQVLRFNERRTQPVEGH